MCGKPCIRGMRFMVSDVLRCLANRMTPEQIVEEFPILEIEDVYAALAYAYAFMVGDVAQ